MQSDFLMIFLKKTHLILALLHLKGHAEKTLGETQDAISSYQSAYKIKPDHGEAFFSLANLKTYSFTNEELQNMKNQINRFDLSLKDKTYFHFALAQGL